jgi:Ser/Thr protein kinase RdoA (MazF antagonist)
MLESGPRSPQIFVRNALRRARRFCTKRGLTPLPHVDVLNSNRNQEGSVPFLCKAGRGSEPLPEWLRKPARRERRPPPDIVLSITEKKLTSEASTIDPRAVDGVLRCYGRVLRGQAACRPIERPGFSGAIVLRIESGGGSFCLRGWPPTIESADRILALHEFLGHVRAQGIDYVAVPVATGEGRTVVHLLGRFWQLEPWLPGSADYWSRPSDSRLAAAFEALAHFHAAARGFEPAGGRPSHLGPAVPAVAPTVLDRLERIERWTPDRVSEVNQRLAQRSRGLQHEAREDAVARAAHRIIGAFTRCAAQLTRELRAAAKIDVPLQPCLRDVWHDHVLFQDDEVTGLIDPSAARTDTVAADISRLAGSLIADDRRAWAVALDAYQSIRRLSEEEARLVGVLDRSGVLLSGMAWLERLHSGGLGLEDRALERVQRIATRLSAITR